MIYSLKLKEGVYLKPLNAVNLIFGKPENLFCFRLAVPRSELEIPGDYHPSEMPAYVNSIYESKAQLFVITNNPEMISTFVYHPDAKRKLAAFRFDSPEKYVYFTHKSLEVVFENEWEFR